MEQQYTDMWAMRKVFNALDRQRKGKGTQTFEGMIDVLYPQIQRK